MSPWASLLTVEGEAWWWGSNSPGMPAKVLQARMICILLRSGPGCKEAVTRAAFGFHVDDSGMINNALGSAEAV